MKHTTQILLSGKPGQIFTGAPDRHVAFTTLLRLDASFAMTPRVLRNRHPVAPDAPPILRSEPANLPPPGFEAQIGKPTTSYVDACSTSRQESQGLQDLSHSCRTGSLLKLAIAFLLDFADAIFMTSMYSCSFVYHVYRSWLHPDSSDPLVQAYSRSPFTALGPSAWTYHLTFTTCHRPPRRILCLHITSQEIHQIHITLSITHHPRVTTISPHSSGPLRP